MSVLSEVFELKRREITRTVVSGSFRGISKLKCKEPTDGPLSHQWWAHQLQAEPIHVSKAGSMHTIDFFCGSGGLTLGAARAIEACGLEHIPLAAVDVDAEALSVYSRNFKPQIPIVANAASLVDYHTYGRGAFAELAYEPEIIDNRLSTFIGKVDLVLAGPPCQGHSNLNNHTRRSDPRNMLYICVAATAVALRARAIVIENVPEVLSDKTSVVATARAILESSGYKVSDGILSASDFGAAQTRKRHFLIATKGIHISIDQASIALRQKPMTLREVIGDLEGAPHRSFLDEIPMISGDNQARIDHLFENGLYELPNDVRPDCHKNGHTYPSVYGRLYWDKPSPTITTGFMSPGRGRYIHPSQRRVITPREAARIQGFPDSFDFSLNGGAPPKKLLSKWIGDAVPSWLGYAATLIALSDL